MIDQGDLIVSKHPLPEVEHHGISVAQENAN